MLLTTSLTPRLRHLASEAANSPRTESQQDEKKLTTEWSKHEIELGEGEGESEDEEIRNRLLLFSDLFTSSFSSRQFI